MLGISLTIRDNFGDCARAFQRWYFRCAAGGGVKRAFAVTQVPDLTGGRQRLEVQLFDPLQTRKYQNRNCRSPPGFGMCLFLQYFDQQVGETRRF